MIALTHLLINDHIRSWKVAVDVILLIIFLSMKVLQEGNPAGNLMAIAYFSLVIVPVVTLRLSRSAASIKCRYILATGIGRARYLLAVALASFLIVLALLVVALFAAVFKSPEIIRIDIVIRLVLLGVIIAGNMAICVFFSKLLVGRWGIGTAIALIILSGITDQKSFNNPIATLLVRYAQMVLPWAGRAISQIGSDPLDGWLIITSQIIFVTVAIGFLAKYVFERKELIFEE